MAQETGIGETVITQAKERAKIEKELGVEIVGDTKIKVPVEDDFDDYEEIIDEGEIDSIDEVKEDYLND